MFVSKFIKTDITALKWHKNLIFAGIGNYLHIYNLQDLVEKVQIFDEHSIHGIVIGENDKLLVFGANCLQTLHFKSDKNEINRICSGRSLDWVLTGQWMTANRIVTIVMGNYAQIYDHNFSVIKTIICGTKCILYSALIVYNSALEELTIFSGTVFGQILLWKITNEHQDRDKSPVLVQLKGHNGVIFAIDYNASCGFIATSSDDRSTILWSIEEESSMKIKMWKKLYGHQSRVFRNKLTNDCVLTAGEDSLINIWDFDGNLLRKMETNSLGTIWAMDVDGGRVISGGANSGILLNEIEGGLSCGRIGGFDGRPKCLKILWNGDVVVVSDGGVVFCYDFCGGKWERILELGEEYGGYFLMEVSHCRKLFSVCGYNGNVTIFHHNQLKLTFHTSKKSRIGAFHWLTCNLFLLHQETSLLLYHITHQANLLRTFQMQSKTWSTAACHTQNGHIIVGDRRGNIHIYHPSSPIPTQIIHKAHSYTGITHLTHCCRTHQTISLGRDGLVKKHHINDNHQLTTICSDKLPFNWLTKYHASDTTITAFSGNSFIIYDYATKRTVCEIECGGGHRTWDLYHSHFCFVKDRIIHAVRIKTLSQTITPNFHSNTINSVKIIDNILISGSEDTNLCISIINPIFKLVHCLKKHLSSIRTICFHKMLDTTVLLFSGGGRGEIICWKLKDLECFEQDTYYNSGTKIMTDSEMRIMDLKIMKINNELFLLAATSDCHLLIFKIVKNETYSIQIFDTLSLTKCITKIDYFTMKSDTFLVALTSDGCCTFWNFTKSRICLKTIKLHQSGIVSYCHNLLGYDVLFMISGGDDNSFVLTLLDRNLDVLFQSRDCGSHCAQVTGVWMGDGIFFTAGIDQKVIAWDWRFDGLAVGYGKRCVYNTTVADVQGMEGWKSEEGDVDVVLFGKGVEVVRFVNKVL